MSCPNERPAREVAVEEFPTARAAIEHARAAGGRAVRLAGACGVISAEDAQWLEANGFGFAYLHELRGRVVSVPVN